VAGIEGAPAEIQKYGDIAKAQDVTIDPTFASIYANVLADTCKGCHNGKLFVAEQALDFSTPDAAYSSLVDQIPFAGGACDGQSKLIVANDCEGSLLYQKVMGSGPSGAALCGAPMPLASSMLSATTTDAICKWIDSGAKK
jgi:hypothetical protein